MVNLTCETCNEVFEVFPSRLRRKYQPRFCSMACRRTLCRSCGGLLQVGDRPGQHKTCRNEENNNKYDALRNECLYQLGNRCACCGETAAVFLTIDHIDGSGTRHRKNRSSHGILHDVLNDIEQYQVLCFNCNWAKSQGGCPHEVDGEEIHELLRGTA